MCIKLIYGGMILSIFIFRECWFHKMLLVAIDDVSLNACLHSKHFLGGLSHKYTYSEFIRGMYVFFAETENVDPQPLA